MAHEQEIADALQAKIAEQDQEIQRLRDEQKLAADDGEPVTEEWLVGIGMYGGNCFTLGMYLDQPETDTDLRRRALVTMVDGAGIMDANDPHRTFISLCEWKARGDVRRLLSALGVEMNPCAT